MTAVLDRPSTTEPTTRLPPHLPVPTPVLRSEPQPSLPTHAPHPSDIILLVAVALWALALRWTNTAAMNDYGLVPALPIVWFVALALTLTAFGIELGHPRSTPARLAAHVGAVVVILHGTVPALFPLPHYIWVYKHLGVVKAVSAHGHLARNVDVYQSWPGFFAASAWLAKIAGLHDADSLGPWAQVTFNLAAALELFWVLGALRCLRRTRWIATMVFVLGNWVGQDYFAPQALAFVLTLAFFGVVLTWLGPDDQQGPPIPAIAAAIGLFTAIVVVHQLTPYIVIASMVLLTITGKVRPRWLVGVLAAEALLYLLPRYGFVAHYGLFGSFGDFFHNAQSNALTSGGLPGRLYTSASARYLSVTVWGLAALGALSRWRRRQPTLVPALLAAAPALLLVAQSYGGEAIFRVFLFSLPWSAFLAASLTEGIATSSRRLAPAAQLIAALALAALFVPAYFGNESINQVWPTDLAGARWFYNHAPRGSTLALAAPNFPVRDAANYADFKMPTGDFEPNLLTVPDLRNVMLGPASLPVVEAALAGLLPAGSHGFLAIGRGERVYVDEFKLMPRGALDGLDDALAGSPRWRLSFRQGGTAIYELIDPPTTETGGTGG